MKQLNPFAVTLLVLAIGVALLVAGVFLLAGLGWALVMLALPFLGAAGILIRGAARV